MSDDVQGYDIRAIRKLLREGFTQEQLRRVCLDSDTLRPVVDDLGSNYNLNDTVDVIIDYCRKRLLFDDLLVLAERENPAQYARLEKRLREGHDPKDPPATAWNRHIQVGELSLPGCTLRNMVIMLSLTLMVMPVLAVLLTDDAAPGVPTPTTYMALPIWTTVPASTRIPNTPSETATSEPSPTMTEPTPSATTTPTVIPTPSATTTPTVIPTPSPGTPAPSPTPGAVVAVIITKGGVELELTEFELRFDSELNGFPIQTGVEVDWKYIDRVEIGDSSEYPVTITLVNGELLETPMGWKRGALGTAVSVVGESNRGHVRIDLKDVRTIDYLWSSPAIAIPSSPSDSDEGPAATVITREDTSIDITGLHFICGKYCSSIGGRQILRAVPLVLGLSVDLTGVKEITFGDAEYNIPVTVTFVDGSGSIQDSILRNTRLGGYAALGELDLLLADVAKVTLRE